MDALSGAKQISRRIKWGVGLLALILIATVALQFYQGYQQTQADKAQLEEVLRKQEAEYSKLRKEKIKHEVDSKQKSDELHDKNEKLRRRQQRIEQLKRELQAKRERERKIALAQQAQATSNTEPTQTHTSQYSGGSCEQYRSLMASYDWDVSTAMRICEAESSGNVRAANWNDDHGECKGSFSLMQTACFWYSEFGYSLSQKYDPEVHMDVAHKVYQRNGWGSWTTY